MATLSPTSAKGFFAYLPPNDENKFKDHLTRIDNYHQCKFVSISKLAVENHEKVEELQKRVTELERIIQELYYSPGQPGFEAAQESFVNKQNEQNKNK